MIACPDSIFSSSNAVIISLTFFDMREPPIPGAAYGEHRVQQEEELADGHPVHGVLQAFEPPGDSSE